MTSSGANRWNRGHAASAIALPFLLLTSSLMAAVLYGIEYGVLPEAGVLIGLFGPALLAIAFVACEKNTGLKALLAQYVRVKAPIQVYLVALFTVPILLLTTQQVAPLMLPDRPRPAFATLTIPQVIFIPLISIGEELGWRGYLQPRMRQYLSLPVASALVGLVWALWHLPGYFFNTGVVDGISFGWFSVWVISGAVILGWLYERSGSVFVAVVFHTSANASFNMILIMPNNAGSPILFQLFAVIAALSATALMLAWLRSAPTHAAATQSP